MRIGIDARLWNETGVGRYISNLVYHLSKIDEENDYVLFVTPETYNADPFNFTQGKNKKWRLVKTDIRWHTVEEQLLFHKVIENEYLDLVHFPYFSIPILYNKPFVITIHDLIINHFPTGKASQLPFPLYYVKRHGYKFILQQAARKAEKILTVSQATKREIIKHLKVSDRKVVVIYEGIDEKIEPPTNIHLPFSLTNKKYFLYVGNAYPHKNIERLIEAFAKVHKIYPKIKLVLVGAKNYFYKKIEIKVKQLNLQNSILITGKVNDSELGVLYQKAEAFIFPSLMEGFGLPGLEAMEHKTLVLASDIQVFKEIYKQAAVYFDPRDSNAMAATMKEVLDGKKNFTEQRSLGKSLVKEYSWEVLAKETLDVYAAAIHS